MSAYFIWLKAERAVRYRTTHLAVVHWHALRLEKTFIPTTSANMQLPSRQMTIISLQLLLLSDPRVLLLSTGTQDAVSRAGSEGSGQEGW